VGLDRLRGLADRIVGAEHWDRLAVRRILDDLYVGQRGLAASALSALDPAKATGGRAQGASLVADWAAAHAERLERTRGFLAELERQGDLSIAKLTLANSQVHELVGR
jgi:glutamate dehydrogenase